MTRYPLQTTGLLNDTETTKSKGFKPGGIFLTFFLLENVLVAQNTLMAFSTPCSSQITWMVTSQFYFIFLFQQTLES